MNDETTNAPRPTSNALTRSAVRDKLVETLSRATGGHAPCLTTPLASLKFATSSYLGVILFQRFHIPYQAGREAIRCSTNLADLVQRIGDLLGLAAEDLFCNAGVPPAHSSTGESTKTPETEKSL